MVIVFLKGGKNIQWRKDSLFSEWCWENWTATCKRMKLEHFLTPYTKINLKRIKDLNVRPDTIKLLEENIGRTLYEINHSKILFDPPPREMEIKTKINKWGASLVAQWLRICLLMQGTRVRALVWEDPTCRGAAGPVSHNC